MSSVMLIKKLLRKSSRAAWVSRQEPGSTVNHMTHLSERQNVTIFKKDNEAFGFNIRTYENDATDSEMFTYVSLVKKNTPAESAGLQTGDVILHVNRTSVKGFEHQQIVDLIQDGSCLLKMEVIRGPSVKQKELQKKRENLQWQLREKTAELSFIITREERLKRGELHCTLPQSRLATTEHTDSSSLLVQT